MVTLIRKTVASTTVATSILSIIILLSVWVILISYYHVRRDTEISLNLNAGDIYNIKSFGSCSILYLNIAPLNGTIYLNIAATSKYITNLYYTCIDDEYVLYYKPNNGDGYDIDVTYTISTRNDVFITYQISTQCLDVPNFWVLFAVVAMVTFTIVLAFTLALFSE